jgi:ABC-type molybdate transport system substrate-binding protein
VLTDRGTWLNFKNRGDLAMLVEGDKRLFNQYGVMVVNPAKPGRTSRRTLAQAFVDWVVSPAGQAAIAGYKIGGEQLFFPNAGAGKAVAVAPFARNALCVLATPTFTLQGKALAQRLLDTDVRVATSTPRADPAGDYAFTMFERIESTGAAGAGSAAALKAKALQLTGGPNSAPPPPGRNVYGVLVAAGQADAFVTYCTNAAQARREEPRLQVLPVPETINVSALYGMAAMNGANADARAWAQFVLGAQGQAILATHGFSAP